MRYCEILIAGPVRNIRKEIFNGDIGRISTIDEEAQVVKVMIDDREIAYDYTDLDELAIAVRNNKTAKRFTRLRERLRVK